MPFQDLHYIPRQSFSPEPRGQSLHCRNRRPLRFFVLGMVLALALVIVFVILPQAEVTLKVTGEPLQTNFEIKLDGGINKVLSNLDIIPAQPINLTIKKTNSQELPALIKKKVSQELKKGQVLFDDLIYKEETDTGEVKVTALVFYQANLDEVIQYHLNQVVASNKELLPAPSDSVKYQVATFKPNEAKAAVEVQLQKTMAPKLDFEKIRKKLTNQKLAEAQKYLDELAGVKEVKIIIKRSFFKKMPLIDKRIDIIIDML